MSYPRIRTKAQRPALLPHIEALEDRNCPSASISVFAGTMYITGDNTPNDVSVAVTSGGFFGDSVTATITSSTNTVPRTAGNIFNIVVRTFGGTDTVAYTRTGNVTGLRNFT